MSEMEGSLGYFTRLGLVLKQSLIFLPVVCFAGYAFSGSPIGFWVAVVLFFALVHQHVVASKGTIVKELKDLSKADLIERVGARERDIAIAGNKIAELEKTVQTLRTMQSDGDLENYVLEEVARALTAYDASRGPVRAMACLEFLRQNLMSLGRDYFEN